MRISYQPTGINNFHNRTAITLIVSGQTDQGNDGRSVYTITASQMRRIERHFCGITDCRCARGSVHQLDADATKFGIPVKYVQA